MRVAIFFLIFFFFCFGGSIVSFADDADLYREAVDAAAHRDFDAAFADLHSLVAIDPHTKFLDRALFCMGEYHFSCGNYRGAQASLRRFVDNYPSSKTKLFALAYLLKIAHYNGDDVKAKAIEREIVSSMKVSLLFRNYKTYRYTSPFGKKYKAVYFIDRIELYVDEKAFVSVSY